MLFVRLLLWALLSGSFLANIILWLSLFYLLLLHRLHTWCVFQMLQTKTKEMISAPYGMGNVPAGVDVQNLGRAFYTRDIRAEDKPLELILTTGIQNTSNPDTFWLANTWRRPLTQAALEQYACLFSQHSEGLLTVATTNAISLIPKSPDSIRVPGLIISALSVTN